MTGRAVKLLVEAVAFGGVNDPCPVAAGSIGEVVALWRVDGQQGANVEFAEGLAYVLSIDLAPHGPQPEPKFGKKKSVG